MLSFDYAGHLCRKGSQVSSSSTEIADGARLVLAATTRFRAATDWRLTLLICIASPRARSRSSLDGATSSTSPIDLAVWASTTSAVNSICMAADSRHGVPSAMYLQMPAKLRPLLRSVQNEPWCRQWPCHRRVPVRSLLREHHHQLPQSRALVDWPAH